MRRTYDRERYLDRVAMIRELVPDCALTTDIIVGFPGETDEDFERDARGGGGGRATTRPSRSSSRRAAAPRRPRSPAACPHDVKRERMERLVEAVQRIATERAQRFVGRTMEVLVEGPSRTDPARLRGRIRHNKTVNFTGVARPGRARRRRDRLRHQHHAGGRGAPARPPRQAELATAQPRSCEARRSAARAASTPLAGAPDVVRHLQHPAVADRPDAPPGGAAWSVRSVSSPPGATDSSRTSPVEHARRRAPRRGWPRARRRCARGRGSPASRRAWCPRTSARRARRRGRAARAPRTPRCRRAGRAHAARARRPARVVAPSAGARPGRCAPGPRRTAAG